MKIYTEKKAENFLKRYVPVARSCLCKNKAQAAKAAKNLGFPVVMKIISEQALHKTEINGVRIVDKESIEKEFDSLEGTAKSLGLPLEGILLQEHLKGREIVIGIKKDGTFGHVIMLGLGGILVELIRDVAFRVCPIDEKEAKAMISELKTNKLLYGYRGRSVNIKALVKTLVNVSKIPSKKPDITELDINPFIINEEYGKVADARIVLE